MTPPIVVAYSGGLDTSWCIGWLREQREAEVITVNIDVGGTSVDERAQLERRALELGASEHRFVDVRRTFFDEILRYLIMGNVLRGGVYPICVGAERSLQAREVAKLAQSLGATTVVHGCTAAGNDQIRFERALRTVAPELEILAPVRDEAPSREREIEDLARWGCNDFSGDAGLYSINSGLWGVTIGGRETLTSDGVLPEEAWVRTRGAFDQLLPPEHHLIAFDAGVPVAVDGREMSPVALIEALDPVAARFGIGRGIHLGDTILGIKGRVAFEAPAATVLIQAHRELEKLTLTAEQQQLSSQLGASYGEWVHHGRFLENICRDVEAFFDSVQQRVTGEVRVLFRPGQSFVDGTTSPCSLMAASSACYGEAVGDWTPADAAGFARVVSVPGVLQARAAEAQSSIPIRELS